MDYKWYAALAYVRANKLNHNVIEGPNDRFGIIASGKAFNDTRQALADLGLDDDTCRQLGIRLHKVNVVWPLEATITRDFAQGLQEILVVEEKRQVIEYQLKEELYNWRADVRPNVLGKFDEAEGDHSRRRMGHAQPERQLAAARQGRPDAGDHRQGDRQAPEEAGRAPPTSRRAWTRAWRSSTARERALAEHQDRHRRARAVVLQRLPAQHQHARARRLARDGRHRLPLHGGVDGPQHRRPSRQMGGEGVPWVGQAPFTTDQHMFANLGDGTYFHSGLLAIRQSIAAGREHHLQDSVQRRGGDDRRPAGRRAARRPLGAADHEEPARRGRDASS